MTESSTPRRLLPLILTGAAVLLAVIAISVFLATGGFAPTAAPSSTPTRAAGSGTEVLPPTATPTVKALGVAPTALVKAPLPKTASAKAKLVAGFPSSVIPLPGATTIISSAISTQGDRMQVTVVATSASAQADVQSYFGAAFAKLGLTASPTPAADGTTATTYSRGGDSITVSTSADPAGTRLSVFALFTAG